MYVNIFLPFSELLDKANRKLFIVLITIIIVAVFFFFTRNVATNKNKTKYFDIEPSHNVEGQVSKIFSLVSNRGLCKRLRLFIYSVQKINYIFIDWCNK